MKEQKKTRQMPVQQPTPPPPPSCVSEASSSSTTPGFKSWPPKVEMHGFHLSEYCQ